MSITKSRLEELRAITEKATPGPWEAFELGSWGGQGFGVNLPRNELQELGNESKMNCFANDNKFGNPHDSLFIAAARTAMPELLDALTDAQAEITRLHEKYDFQELVKREERMKEKLEDAKATMEKIAGQTMSMHLTKGGMLETVMDLARECLGRMK